MTRTRAGQSAEWWREYRRKNRERLAAQQAERRRKKPRVRGDRSGEYAARNAKRNASRVVFEPVPPLHTGHEVLEQAVALVERLWRRDRRTAVYDALWDDCVCEVVLALVAGDDPEMHVRRFRRSEMTFRRLVITGTGMPNLALDEEGE